MMTNEQIKLIEGLMKKTPAVALTSLCEDGYPMTVTMASIRNDGLQTIWFATGFNANKVRRFSRDPRASVCYHADHHNISLTGDIEVITDAQLKKDL